MVFNRGFLLVLDDRKIRVNDVSKFAKLPHCPLDEQNQEE